MWKKALDIIKSKLDERTYKVWFSPVECEKYDQQRNELLLRAPSKYVCEYIEYVQWEIFSGTLREVFGPKVQLQWHIAQEPTCAQVIDHLSKQGFTPGTTRRLQLSFPDAPAKLRQWMHHFLGDNCKWLPAYDEVAAWLSDNKGRGLLCIGAPGLGKTRLCCDVLPCIFGKAVRTISAHDLRANLDSLLKERCIIIDDLGQEPEKSYGAIDNSFLKLCDAAERQGILLIISTRLSTTPVPDEYRATYPLSIQERYGPAVLDRLRGMMKSVIFEGSSMR